jgi:hypothetical protein
LYNSHLYDVNSAQKNVLNIIRQTRFSLVDMRGTAPAPPRNAAKLNAPRRGFAAWRNTYFPVKKLKYRKYEIQFL